MVNDKKNYIGRVELFVWNKTQLLFLESRSLRADYMYKHQHLVKDQKKYLRKKAKKLELMGASSQKSCHILLKEKIL
jgi:hypothetical protein